MGSVVEPQLYSDVTNLESLKKSKKKKQKTDLIIEDVVAAAAVIPPRTMNVKVELIPELPERTSPVVGYFPSGYYPHNMPTVNLYKNFKKVKIDTGAEEKSPIHHKGPEKLELVVTPEDSKIDFVGTSYRGEASSAQLADYALGVLDKDNNTLKIMPIAGNKIFRLEAILRGRAAIAANEDPPTEEAELTAQQKAAKKRSKLDAYSTKKSIARNKKMRNLTEGLDQEPHPDLDNKISSIPVNKQATVSTAIDVARNIPPHNASATIPKEAYPLDKIIDGREWEFLEDLQSGEMIGSTYPIFVRNRIHKLKGVEDDSERAKLSRILCYVTHLVKFKNSKFMDAAAATSARNHTIPDILKLKFGKMFEAKDLKSRMPDDKLYLLIRYVLVLVLHFDDFKTDPADIARDLGQSIKNLRIHFESLGCKFVVGENKVRLATLPVPLRFPEATWSRRKRN